MSDDKTVSGLELWQWRTAAIAAAKSADVPPKEVDWILQEVAGLDRLALYLESFKDRPEIKLTMQLSQLDRLWQRRIHEQLPVQYITGIAPWRHFSLIVSPAVLIPRPETEYLIDLAVEAVKRGLGAGQKAGVQASAVSVSRTGCRGAGENFSATPDLSAIHLADLGTGSGAIALGLADAFPDAAIHAVDSSSAALAIAQENAQRLGFSQRIQFYQGSWFEPLEGLKGKLSAMVSNPPYIPRDMVPTLQPEVAKHEPHSALDGGDDGLDCIRHLVAKAPDYLRPGGIWLVEMMAGQADAVVKLLQDRGSYCEIQVFSDLAGIERFVLAYRGDW